MGRKTIKIGSLRPGLPTLVWIPCQQNTNKPHPKKADLLNSPQARSASHRSHQCQGTLRNHVRLPSRNRPWNQVEPPKNLSPIFLNRFETTRLWDVLSSHGVPRSTSGCYAMFKLCWLSRAPVQKVPSVASWIKPNSSITSYVGPQWGHHRGGLVENSGIYGDVIDLTIKPYNLNGVKWWRFSCGSSKPSWI